MAATSADVIVVGAGLAGLCAAAKARAGGASVIVVEGRDRVGGRTHSPTINGCVVDLGAGYVGPGQNRILRLIRELGLSTYLVRDEGKIVLETSPAKAQKKTFAEYSDALRPPFGLFASLDVNNLLVRMENICNEFPTLDVWNSPQAAKYDSTTVQQWIDSEVWTGDSKRIVELAVRVLLCAEPSEVSMLFWIFLTKSGESFSRLSSTTNGAQERKVKEGTQQISVELAKKLDVRLNAAVRTLKWSDAGVQVVCQNGETFEGKYCILAFAPTLWNTVIFDPPLPDLHRQLSQRMPMGSIIKTVTYYEKAFWREKGYRGQIYGFSGPVMATFDDTKPDGSHPALMGFILANFARENAELTKEDRQKLVAQQYSEFFKSPEALKPLRYEEKNWSEDPFSGGCYMGLMTPSTLTQLGHVLRKPLGPIHFAGTEVALEWSGYMDGAVQSGETAAYDVLVRLHKDEKERIPKPVPPPEKEPEDPIVKHLPLTIGTLEKILPSPGTVLTVAVVLIGVAVGYVASRL